MDKMPIDVKLYNEFKEQKKELEYYKNAVNLSFCVSRHDKDGNIIHVNEMFCKLTNLTHKEALKGILNPLNNPLENMKDVWNDIHEKHIYKGIQSFLILDNTKFIMEVTAVPICNEKNEIEEIIVFSSDVTEITLNVKKIKAHEIDKKIQKLEHAKEMNKVKDSYLTVFSHELKTPLNAIINFSEYVEKHLNKENFTKKDRLIQQVSNINASGHKMLDMITNLIEAIKLRDSSIELTNYEFSLNNTIENVIQKYNKDLVGIKVIRSYSRECIIYSDEIRVSQILNNLLSNAIKYAKSKIIVSLKSNKTKFILGIIDDGKGFENTDKVYNLFEQFTDNEMTRTAQGAGVGLFVVNKLSNIMGFKIELLNSDVLGGAKVTIKGIKDIRK